MDMKESSFCLKQKKCMQYETNYVRIIITLVGLSKTMFKNKIMAQ